MTGTRHEGYLLDDRHQTLIGYALRPHLHNSSLDDRSIHRVCVIALLARKAGTIDDRIRRQELPEAPKELSWRSATNSVAKSPSPSRALAATLTPVRRKAVRWQSSAPLIPDSRDVT